MKALRPFTEPLSSIGTTHKGVLDEALFRVATQPERPCPPPLNTTVRSSVKTTRVLVAHEDPLMALGAFSALMSAPDVRAFMDGSDAFSCSNESIDVVVADSTHGLSLASTPKSERRPQIRDARVLVLETSAREHVVRRAFAAGV